MSVPVLSGFIIYLLVLTSLAVSLPAPFVAPGAREFIFLVGIIGMWRYGWGGVHFFRSWYYRAIKFPRERTIVDSEAAQSSPSELFILVTTHRIPSDVSLRVYRAAIDEALRVRCPATIVASVVELADERMLRSLIRHYAKHTQIGLTVVRIPGTGKRDALAAGFRAIAQAEPKTGALVAVIDGDSVLPPRSLADCVGFFSRRPQLGALTTDEICEIQGWGLTTALYRRWHELRFAQRNILMGSVALSRRVLTLTGRMSLFRAKIVVEPAFIQSIEYDYIDHWRLGRFRFLTGDDKSSWFYLLREGWEMTYVPDVQVVTVEEPPDPNFLVGTSMLMMRWFGNMLRANQRALGVSPRTCGLFVWWCLLDQRVSMWTSLFGVTAAAVGTMLFGAQVLVAYAIWVGITRFVQSLMLLTSRPSLSLLDPFLIYFNQIYGSLVKVYMVAHLNRQRWTRQRTSFKDIRTRGQQWFEALYSNVVMCTSLLVLFVVAAFALNAFELNDVRRFIGVTF